MYKIYIVQNTLQFLISALRTCVVSAFPPCHAARMNQTPTQTKMSHAVLYASFSHSPAHKRVWNRAFWHIRLSTSIPSSISPRQTFRHNCGNTGASVLHP